jgi:DNA-binding LytR/AlgR family response regulator
MIDVLLYDRSKKEQEKIETRVRDSVAVLSDDRLECKNCEKAEQVDAHLANGPTVDLSMLEVACDEDIGLLRRVRQYREQADMMVMADSSISPMKYMTPDIRACSLLLKPFSDEQMSSVVHEFMSSFYRKKEQPTDENSVVIENREGRIVVPFSHIYYVEAREKKVFFRLKDREYSMYSTLENVKGMLPSNFIQSHRSFLFNTSYLEKIKLSENLVYLEHGILVPLSRSFKASIKEYLNGLSNK